MKFSSTVVIVISFLLSLTAVEPALAAQHVDSAIDISAPAADQADRRRPVADPGAATARKHNSIAASYVLEQRRRKLQAPPCHERPIAVREPNASVIFTGTVRYVEADDQRPGLLRASVEIKRVLKGGYVLSRLPRRTTGAGGGIETMRDASAPTSVGTGQKRVVIVEGIGDPTICYSETRLHDTRIFFANKASDGELTLNSSLARMTLENIAQTEAAVRGELY